MKNNINKLISTLCLIVLAGVVNSILFNVTLEDMARELKVTSSAISWIVISYTLVLTFGSVTYSKLASYFQIKNLLLIGVLLFSLGSLIGFFSSSYTGVLLGRIIQATGGSSFIALSMITANQYIPVSKRNIALTLIGGCLSLGSGLGFLIGGILAFTWGWHALFLLMSLTLLTVFGLYFLIPSGYAGKERINGPFDILGLFYLIIFVTSFILGVKLNGYLLLLSIISVFLLGLHSKKKEIVLFIDPSVLRNFSFNRLILISFINNAAAVATLFLFPLMMNRAFHLSAVRIGFIICMVSIISFLISFMIRKTAWFMSNEKLMFISIVMQLIGFCVLAFFGMPSIIMAIIGLFLIYSSYSTLTVIINLEIPQHLEREKAAMGLGLYNLINFLGMSFGPSMSSRILGIYTNFAFVLQSFVVLLIVSLLLFLVGRKNSQF
ncbi:MFS transporter [Peribacillus frigoritolerans]|uniref:MFS transporter n=1 Tax=Peribacillus frigoritolerans TaxID=450367 RepID=UPI0025A24F54|nr:MFS transporter [Peribacillus frigoritolerans]MDM5312815.1 MFS transporter [Peribacillus frigoritolerans]